jgi:hypothetical protein
MIRMFPTLALPSRRMPVKSSRAGPFLLERIRNGAAPVRELYFSLGKM